MPATVNRPPFMYQKSILNSGIRVITEKIPSRTVSMGIWVDAGSRDEELDSNGEAHFVEHMLFKGTSGRSSEDIARDLDRLGGMSNAFTSKETTCLYGTVLDSHLPRLIDLLTDLFLNSLFDRHEVERERQVILQEIAMVEDSPEELIHDLFASQVWHGHPLSNSVLGRPKVVGSMNSADLHQFIRDHYTPDRIVIAAAGNVDHDALLELLAGKFSCALPPPAAQPASLWQRKAPRTLPASFKVQTKSLEQAHLLLGGGHGQPADSPERYQQILLNILLGGNMSSRLFQEIREKRGLAYSIYSFIDASSDCGMFGVYAGVGAGSVNQVLDLTNEVLSQLCHTGPTLDELDRARDFARAGMYLAAESMESRMTRLARNEMIFGRCVPIEEVDQALSRVTSADVAGTAAIFKPPLTVLVLGPVTSRELPGSIELEAA